MPDLTRAERDQLRAGAEAATKWTDEMVYHTKTLGRRVEMVTKLEAEQHIIEAKITTKRLLDQLDRMEAERDTLLDGVEAKNVQIREQCKAVRDALGFTVGVWFGFDALIEMIEKKVEALDRMEAALREVQLQPTMHTVKKIARAALKESK